LLAILPVSPSFASAIFLKQKFRGGDVDRTWNGLPAIGAAKY
jgi:hypothetical protein